MVSFAEGGEKLYRIGEASILLRVHPNTLRRWEKQGRIKTIRVGKGHRKVPESEINRIVRQVPALAVPSRPIISGNELSQFLNFVFSRHKDDWELVKRAIIVRDGYSCQSCASREMLDVHHLDGTNRNDPDNLVTLCQRCHLNIHPKVHVFPDSPAFYKQIEEKPFIQASIQENKQITPKFQAKNEISRQFILDGLNPSGLIQRTAFGDLISAAGGLKKFAISELANKGKCPEETARIFCEKMAELGYFKRSDEKFELAVAVVG
ncbi:MAG: MerR family DNA-binding transcriptional regulator [Candidatus Hadarchaeota archaeon]